jgi:hypothetical protein
LATVGFGGAAAASPLAAGAAAALEACAFSAAAGDGFVSSDKMNLLKSFKAIANFQLKFRIANLLVRSTLLP